MNRDDFERRRAERRHALNFLEFAVLDEAGGVLFREMGRTLNVSATGIKLETPALLEAGQNIRVSVGLKNEMLELLGRVAHGEVIGESLFSAGIAFTQLDEAGERILEGYLAAFRDTAAGD